MSWDTQLAKQFKQRDNPKKMGPVIGVTVSVDPPKIQLQDGQFVLEGKKLYICKHLMERKSKAKLSGSHTQSGIHNGSSYTSSGEITVNGDIELDVMWKPGDKVLCVPDESGQHFFVVDVIKEG